MTGRRFRLNLNLRKNMSFRPISEIGEFGLIDRLTRLAGPTLGSTPGLLEGIGDDCAVYRPGPSLLEVATTDLLLENVHFDLLTTPMHHLGSKAISVSVSDICAMNALPRYALVSIAVPRNISVEMVEALYAGMCHAAARYGLAIAGGDTSFSHAGLMISVAMTGEVAEKQLTRRRGARPGDLVCVTGTLGGAAAGLRVLQRERNLMMELLAGNEPYDRNVMVELEEYAGVIRCQLLPEARQDIVHFLHGKSLVPTAMIDVSDGLCADLGHLCGRSSVGAHIREGSIPVQPQTRMVADEFQEDAITWALSGGEDYQLLFTLPRELHETVSAHRDVSVIGEITPPGEGIMMTDIFGMSIDLAALGGFDHFR
jgi:thiamine-monophosphate kinase